VLKAKDAPWDAVPMGSVVRTVAVNVNILFIKSGEPFMVNFF